jgi:hypothetical protein
MLGRLEGEKEPTRKICDKARLLDRLLDWQLAEFPELETTNAV